jgi:DNA-nicking Smr family endonuclease
MKTSFAYMPFKGLEETIRKKKIVLSKREIVMVKTDEEIFADAMADVREIREFRETAPKQPPKIAPAPAPKDNSLEDLSRLIKGEMKIRISDTGEYIEWIRPDTRKDIVRKLHQGEFSVQDYIDLHGMTLIEAEQALSLFFKEAIRKRMFCIKVIHGRGLRSPKGPVLKEALEKLLQGQFRKWILAYATAKDCDGGLGATYIILKSR